MFIEFLDFNNINNVYIVYKMWIFVYWIMRVFYKIVIEDVIKRGIVIEEF